jgi:hypothetical protein
LHLNNEDTPFLIPAFNINNGIFMVGMVGACSGFKYSTVSIKPSSQGQHPIEKAFNQMGMAAEYLLKNNIVLRVKKA